LKNLPFYTQDITASAIYYSLYVMAHNITAYMHAPINELWRLRPMDSSPLDISPTTYFILAAYRLFILPTRWTE